MSSDWPGKGSKSKQLVDEATALAATERIPLTLAMIRIGRENPQLSEAARREVLGEGRAAAIGTRVLHETELGLSEDPNGLLARVAANRAKHKGIEYHLALSEVKRDYPKLARASDRQVLGTEDT
jgi:hypothetical protein